jgi:hypothetical protein
MSAQPISDPELVEVFDTMQESEAMIVHGLPGVGGLSIRVNPTQEKEALRVIQDYRANPASEDDSMLADGHAAETK